MAYKSYYSTTPPSQTGTLTPSPYSATPVTNLNLPGDYYLRANPQSGEISFEAGQNINAEAGVSLLVDAGTSVEITTPGTSIIGNVRLGKDFGLSTVTFASKVDSDIVPKISAYYNLGSESNTWDESWTQTIRNLGENNVGNPFGFVYDPNDVFGAEYLGGSISIANGQRQEGSAYFAGGVGIQKDLNVGGHIYGRITIAQTSLSILVTATNQDIEYHPVFVLNTGQQFLWLDEQGVEAGLTYNPFLGRISTDRMLVLETDPATSADGALRVEGGASIGDNLYVGSETLATDTDGAVIVMGGVSVGKNLYVNDETLATDTDGAAVVVGGVSVGKNLYVGDETEATDTDGAAIVVGGVSVGKNLWVNTDAYVEDTVEATEVNPHSDDLGNIGTTSTAWHEEYVNNIYTKIIRSTTGTIQIAPKDPLTEILGDIRVRGTNPIGTAPVVTNTLYVTMDGDDTNDGRAIDPSRACRTIGGAINSPYYRPGTQILVSAGHYLEDNPLRMKPYTSVRGSDIRTTFVEPINKTQDLFHLDSGCYLNYMNFLNGRSGLLEGQYTNGFNRGAYATAFPPLTGDDRIDLFQSPYVQNCTNQSGPWLKDGTLFVPNQTVQVPDAVAVGSWPANTTTIVVSLNTGTIELGMAISPGQQNPGFFNARTLMLANKPFLQEQVVAFVDQTFNSGSFTYDSVACKRDLSVILDSIGLDLLYDSDSESTFAGLQYWSQGGYTGNISSEITATIAAINYLQTIAATTATFGSGSAAMGTIVTQLFNTLTNILSTSSNLVGITDVIDAHPNGLASTTATYVNAYNSLIGYKSAMQAQVIAWITSNYPTLVYNSSTCARDVGYIIDSVAFDLLHGGTKQTIKSAVYYYGYQSTSTQVPNEIPQVTSAYNYLKSIIPSIVKGVALPTTYQSTITQQISGYEIAGNYEADQLQNKIDVITDIIRNGPTGVEKTPINLTVNPSEEAENAFLMLQANKNFIKAEVTAYIDATANTFNYSREYCFRDVGILVENVAYDAAFGGNQKAVESGLAYYDGVISKISGQETQTISAIDYLNELVQQVITNTTCTDLLSGSGDYIQVRNTVLTGGEIASNAINGLFDIITDIIGNGPNAAPTTYLSSGPDAAYVSAEILMQANRKFIQEDTINYINQMVQEFPYSERKCRRDTKLIVDAISQDLKWATTSMSQSTFVGLQYWSQGNYTGSIQAELRPTIDAVTYLKDLSVKIIQNIQPTDDLVDRYQTAVAQNTSTQAATINEANAISNDFDIVLEILGGNKTGWTDRIIPNSTASTLPSVLNAYTSLQLNKSYMAAEILAYVNTTHPDFTFNTSTCARDVGYIIDSICYDLKHSGNRQAIQAGLYYYGYNGGTTIQGQETATVAAYNRIYDIIDDILTNTPVSVSTGNTALQVMSLPAATVSEVTEARKAITTITNIISGGSSVAGPRVPISLIESTSTNVKRAYDILQANRNFIAEEVISYVDWRYNENSFNYNEELCYRDTGLIVDAVSQDILLGGNSKSIECGLAYWNQGYNYVAGQESTTTMAINHARDIALQIIANQPVTPQTGTVTTQVINEFFQYGGDYMPQQAVQRNFGIITNIIENGPLYAPPTYQGSGLFASVGISADDVKLAPRVTSINTQSTNTYIVGLSTSTVGFGTSATLYFGETLIYPKQDADVPAQWAQRRVDPIGSMGGSLVDGGVISSRSPIQSFVYDAFTQLTQGGRGVHIKNDGYAQLVSVFTIFSSIGVEVESGGIASIVNSNANFGDICLQAKGYGTRKFSGHIYNPINKAYPESPDPAIATSYPDSEYFDQYYPTGFWPNDARVRVFLPDTEDRPHISLVMEVVPPETVTDYTGAKVPQVNEQGFPGFLNAAPTTSTLTTGTITITGIDNSNVAVGNHVYIRDLNNSYTGTNGLYYAETGTVVTALGYKSVTLSKALTSGGFDPEDPTNPDWFNIYFCGNAYYTVLSSEVGENPEYNRIGQLIPIGTNVLSTASTGLATSQVAAHIGSLQKLKALVGQVINNETIIVTTGTTSTQYTNLLITGGGESETFINQRFDEIINIINAANLTAAEAVVKPSQRTKEGPTVQGAGSAISLIKNNIEFLADEISSYVQFTYGYTPNVDYDDSKCQRDVKIILQRVIYDIETGGRYNSAMTGLSYWNRAGTYHLVQLGENVRDSSLFPDGATVNFYQRSYISASGYVFEYVGAGTNYGALPQRGVADPVQGKEVVMLDSGKVFFTSTDQNGDFRIGPGLVISQATGVLSGRTFTKSLYAYLTPFILAIEGGGQ